MIDENASKAIEQAVCYELQNAVKNFGATYHSEHEGYAVLLEEFQEASEDLRFMSVRLECVWHAVRNNDPKTLLNNLGEVKQFALALAEEAVQCAAVCEKFMGRIKDDTSTEA